VELSLPSYVKREILDGQGICYRQATSLEAVLPELDILYMTRIQRERFEKPEEYERLKDSYILTADKLTKARKDLIVMHPLPRVNEISVSVDKDPRACYFLQALCGKYMRMALILKLLETADKDVEPFAPSVIFDTMQCQNPTCITAKEQELSHAFYPVNEENGIYRCVYCEEKVIR